MVVVNGVPHDEYFVQTVQVIDNNNQTRFDFLLPYVIGKHVLHVGFVDYPITDPSNNLHLKLAPHCLRLDGYDVNNDHIDKLTVKNGKNYSDWTQVPDDYEVIIVPEVIEHVGNSEDFLKQISQKTGTMIVTAPDSVLMNNRYQVLDNQGLAFEVVHPDHNCVYTPYTLKNLINKYSYKKVQTLHWVGYQSIAAICK